MSTIYILSIVAALCVVGVIVLAILRSRGGAHSRLDLLSARGRARFLASGYRSVSLLRTRASYFRDAQYQSYSEREVPLDADPPKASGSTTWEEKLKVMAEDADGSSFPVFETPFSEVDRKRLAECVKAWKARRKA